MTRDDLTPCSAYDWCTGRYHDSAVEHPRLDRHSLPTEHFGTLHATVMTDLTGDPAFVWVDFEDASREFDVTDLGTLQSDLASYIAWTERLKVALRDLTEQVAGDTIPAVPR